MITYTFFEYSIKLAIEYFIENSHKKNVCLKFNENLNYKNYDVVETFYEKLLFSFTVKSDILTKQMNDLIHYNEFNYIIYKQLFSTINFYIQNENVKSKNNIYIYITKK